MEGQRSHSYLADAVPGGIDGCLGFANLVADGFSMAAGNCASTKSQREQVERARREEHRHIEEVPGGEREEVRQIFARKGFHGETPDRIVATLTLDRELWVDTMVTLRPWRSWQSG